MNSGHKATALQAIDAALTAQGGAQLVDRIYFPLREARAGLAELIAATKDNVASGCPCSGCERVRAALAAVGEGSPA